jgi:diguanylate cyclase
MVAERLRKKVEENVFRAYDEKLAITVSIGTAIYPEDADSLSSLVERADMALYNAKKSGKNIVRGYKKGYNNSL